VDDQALLLDAPIHYDLDSTRYTLEPSVRYSDKGSYSSLDSDYYHLKSTASYSSELQTLSLNASANRDSSLEQYALASNGIGVRADALSGGADWQYAFTERAGLEVAAGFNRTLYNNIATLSGLVDYKYLSETIGPTYALTERDLFQLSVSGGQYQSLDRITASHSASVQLSLNHQLTEIWSLSTAAGYAKSDNTQTVYIGPFYINGLTYGPYYIGTAKSVQRGPVFSVGLRRQGETTTFSADASRNYVPTGFEYLSRQDQVQIDLTHILSDRWSYGGHLSYQDTDTPAVGGPAEKSHYYTAHVSVTYHWTSQWMVSLGTAWMGAKYSQASESAQSTNVSLQISRQFLRMDL
jgi:hypothetical protein